MQRAVDPHQHSANRRRYTASGNRQRRDHAATCFVLDALLCAVQALYATPKLPSASTVLLRPTFNVAVDAVPVQLPHLATE